MPLFSSNAIHEDVEVLRKANVPNNSLFPLLQKDLVDMKEIRKRGYSSVLALVQHLIGLQPTCDMALEIWPPAFECYNLTVPNLLNLPHMLLGTKTGAAPKSLVSIAMYVSSRANGCAYCASHCASFAARRGVDPQVLRELLTEVSDVHNKRRDDDSSDDLDAEDETERTSSSHHETALVRSGSRRSKSPNTTIKGANEAARMAFKERKRQAVVKVAYGLGTVPASLEYQDVQEVYACLSEDDVEWIVAAATMFGSFNKLMDGLGIPLEERAYSETVRLMDENYKLNKAGSMIDLTKKKETQQKQEEQEPQEEDDVDVPPTDTWRMKASCIYQGLRPGGALALDGKLHGDTPNTKDACVAYLLEKTGSSMFGKILSPLRHLRVIRALTSIVAKNFDPEARGGTLGVGRKVMAGVAFCRNVLQNETLTNLLLDCAVKKFPGETNFGGDDGPLTRLVLKVAEAVSYTPNKVTPEMVEELRVKRALLKPAMLVELVTFLAIIQMLHRVQVFYHVKELGEEGDRTQRLEL